MILAARLAASGSARTRLGTSVAGRGMLALGVAGLAILGGWSSRPAAAGTGAEGPAVITFSAPATDGATLTQAPVTLDGEIDRPGGTVDGVDVAVRWTDTVANRPPAPHPAQQTTLHPSEPSSVYAWSFTPRLDANGRYMVTVVATTDAGSGSRPTTASRSFVVDVKPVPPANVTETADQAQRTVGLAWSPNPEPDLSGYEVERAGPRAEDPGKVIALVAPSQPQYTDSEVATEPPGGYRYHVIAMRQSGDGTTTDLSAPSAESDATFSSPPRPGPPTPPATAGGPKRSFVTSSQVAAGAEASGQGAAPAPVRSSLPPGDQALPVQTAATAVTTAPPDPGYSAHLPYRAQTTRQDISVPAPVARTATLGAGDGQTATHQTIESIAGALLLLVAGMFLLVLKRAADQAGVLEALAPGPVDGAAPFGMGASATASEPVAGPVAPAIGDRVVRVRRSGRGQDPERGLAVAAPDEADALGPTLLLTMRAPVALPAEAAPRPVVHGGP